MKSNNVITNNLEVLILISISGLLFLDVFLGVSAVFPDGWFHLVLGVFLFISAVVLFTSRNE